MCPTNPSSRRPMPNQIPLLFLCKRPQNHRIPIGLIRMVRALREYSLQILYFQNWVIRFRTVALLVPAANEPNADSDILSLPTATDADHSTTQTSPLPRPFQESADRVVAEQSQPQPSSSTTEQTARRGDTPHDSRTNATSTSLESASGANDASTNSSIGPIRRGSDRNRDTIVASQTPTSAILRCVENRLRVKMV
ncbi:unnamed protein product [Rhizoctonia solani]|uniref:Uncharacterized protein n=1 Tax=Rhizoctonia solani TaxID=456999 RepID=A0A8H3HXG8_9AGAM|nr:unnamed protein product [Rhizoctonia solani]